MAVITSTSERLKLLRKKQGITQAELADSINVSRESVAKWESTSGIIPRTADVIALADFYGVSCDYILRGWDVENKTVTEQLGLTNEAVNGLKNAAQQFPDSLLMFSDLFSDEDAMLVILSNVERACEIKRQETEIQDNLLKAGLRLNCGALVQMHCDQAGKMMSYAISCFVHNKEDEHAAKKHP